jgi:hypothetical protein
MLCLYRIERRTQSAFWDWMAVDPVSAVCVHDVTIMGRITGIMNSLPIIRRSIEGDHLLPWLVIFCFA